MERPHDIITPDSSLDCRGDYCPVPVTRTAERIKSLRPGEVLAVMGNDPGLQIDIPAWCMSNKHHFLGIQNEPDYIVCFIKVGED